MIHIIFWLYIVSLFMMFVSVFFSLMLRVKIRHKWYASYTAVLAGCSVIMLSYTFFFFIFKYSYKVTALLNNLLVGMMIVISLVFSFVLVGLNENTLERKMPVLQKGMVISSVILSLISILAYLFFSYTILVYLCFFFILFFLALIFLPILKEWKKNYSSGEKKVVLYFTWLASTLFPIELAEAYIHKKLIPADTYVPLGVITLSLFCLIMGLVNIVHCIRYFYSFVNPGRTDYEDVPEDFVKKFSITGREKEIVEYLVKGYNHQDISGYLGISKRTVEKHSYNVYKKCRISSRVELVNLIRDYQ